MRKSLFYKYLFFVLLGHSATITGQSIDLIKPSTILNDMDLIEESIYYPVSPAEYITQPHLLQQIDIDKQYLKNVLYAADLNLSHQIKQFDKQHLINPEIQSLVTDYLSFANTNGLIPNEVDLIDYGRSMGVHQKQNDKLAFHLGYSKLKQKEFTSALNSFSTCQDIKSEYFNHARYYSGLILILNKDFKRAYEEFKKITRINIFSEQLPYYLAASHFAIQQYDDVIKWYEPRLNERHLYNYTELKKIVAMSHYKLGHYHKTIELIPEEDNTLGLLISSLIKVSDYNSVVKKLKKINGNQLSSNLRFQLAIAYHYTNDYQQSNELLSLLIEDNSQYSHDDIWFNMAQNHIKLGQYQLAINSLQKISPTAKIRSSGDELIASLVINSDQFENDLSIDFINGLNVEQKGILAAKLKNTGINSLNNNDLPNAQIAMARSELINANSIETALLRAHIGFYHFVSNNYQEAIKELNNIDVSTLNHLPDDVNYNINYALGYIFSNKKEFSRSLGHFSKCISYEKSLNTNTDLKEDVWLRMADAYFALENYTNAQELYNDSYRLNATQGDYALYQLGAIQKINANLYEQIMIYEELIDKYPSSKYVNKSNMEVGNRYFELGQYNNAESYYDLVSKSNDDQLRTQAYLQLGLINVNAGDYNKAKEYYTSVLNNDVATEYRRSAQRALEEIYSTYALDSDAYIDIARQTNPNESEEDILYSFAIEQYHNKEYEAAIQALEKYDDLYPKSSNSENVSLYLIRSNIKIGSDSSEKLIVNHLKSYGHEGHSELTDQLSIMLLSTNSYNDYIQYNQLGWFDSIKNQKESLFLSLINTKEVDSAIDILNSESLELETIEVEKGLKILVNELAMTNKWSKLQNLYASTNTNQVWISDPKMIHIVALTFFNKDQIHESIDHITTNYESLITDPSWFAKATLLLSDNYYLIEEKTMAIASLEAMLSSGLDIPPSLVKQAKSRLSELNL